MGLTETNPGFVKFGTIGVFDLTGPDCGYSNELEFIPLDLPDFAEPPNFLGALSMLHSRARLWRWLGLTAVLTRKTRGQRNRQRPAALFGVIAAEVERLEARTLLTFTFHGGSVIANIEAQNVFLGSDWGASLPLQNLETQLNAYTATAVGGSQLDGLTLAGYNVYRGSSTPGVVGNFTLDKSYPASGFINGFFLNDSSGFTGGIADSADMPGFTNSIQGLLQNMIDTGTVQQPDANGLYIVWVEPGVIVSLNGFSPSSGSANSNSVIDFGGYHGAFTGATATGVSEDIRYAVIPFPGFPNALFANSTVTMANALNQMTTVASHEISEAATDPDVTFANATFDETFLGWVDDSTGEEIADESQGFKTIAQDFVVQLVEDPNGLLINPNAVTHTLGAPTNLALTPLTPTTATLSWTGSSLAQGYKIFSLDGTTQTLLGTVGSAVDSFTVGAATSYMVQAFDGPTTANSSVLPVGTAFGGFVAAPVVQPASPPAAAPAAQPAAAPLTAPPVQPELGGQWAVTSGGTSTLASVTQSTDYAILIDGGTTTVTTIGYDATLGQIQLQLPDSTTIALVNDSFTLKGQVWTKLDLPASYTSSFGGSSSVTQNGTTSLTFVNSQGQTSPGYWLSPTQVVATAFGNEVGIVGSGKISWSTGEIWSENVALTGTQNGASGAIGIAATPSVAVLPDQYSITSYVNSANGILKQFLIQNGTNTALFINDAGQMATGTFSASNPTQLNIAAWGTTATIGANQITFSNGLSWTQTVLGSTSPVVITSYVNVGDAGRRYLVQNGTSQVALLNTTVNLGTLTSATTFTVPAVGLTATFGSGQINFTNGSSWMQTDLGNSLPVSVASYVNSTDSSQKEFYIQNGTSTALFINDAGQMALGTFINPTQATIADWGVTATIGSGQISFSNGTAWTLSFLGSSPITITSFANQSDSGARYLVQNGTSQLAILNAHMVLGTFTSATQFNVPSVGLSGTIGAGQISFTNGSSWFQTSPVANSVSVNYYVSPSNANQGEVYTNGTSVLFVKSDGSRAFGTLVSGTTYNIAAWGLQATFGPGEVAFSNGSFWFQTNSPLPSVALTDTTGATFKVQMLSPTTFIALGGSMVGMTGTRQDNAISWSNGDVWTGFDDNALHALFQMSIGYP
jgi:hypothetical protein